MFCIATTLGFMHLFLKGGASESRTKHSLSRCVDLRRYLLDYWFAGTCISRHMDLAPLFIYKLSRVLHRLYMNIGALERELKLCSSSNLKPIDHNLQKPYIVLVDSPQLMYSNERLKGTGGVCGSQHIIALSQQYFQLVKSSQK